MFGYVIIINHIKLFKTTESVLKFPNPILTNLTKPEMVSSVGKPTVQDVMNSNGGRLQTWKKLEILSDLVFNQSMGSNLRH